MTLPPKQQPSGDIMESVVAKGDLAKLTSEERVRYYNEVCKSMGLNPLTQPFSYITLNGRLTLYATRNCTDQLRKVNQVSLEVVSRDVSDGILTVHVRARMPSHDGIRVDEDLGAVSFPDALKGEARANAELKAVTKAKRRATLSICGLSFLDETEVEDIPAAAKRPPKAAPNVMRELPPHDQETGEIIETSQPDPDPPEGAKEAPAVPASPLDAAGATSKRSLEPDDILRQHNAALAEASKEGERALREEWASIHPMYQKRLKNALERIHKPAAVLADRERGAPEEEIHGV
jgi:hypothetical protein